MEWMTVTTLLMSWLMRAGVPISKISQEMKAIQATEGGWADQKYHKSMVAYLGHALEELSTTAATAPAVTLADTFTLLDTKITRMPDKVRPAFTCPQCGGHTAQMKEGCQGCADCTYSKCS